MLPFCESKKIGFVYDLGFLHYPDAYPHSLNKLKNQTMQLVKHADRIVTISEVSKKDIAQEYHTDEQQIIVAYPGIDARFTRTGMKHKEDHPYIVSVGALKRGKNIPLAISICRKTPYDLILVGGDYWKDPNIVEGSRVKLTGFLPDETLAEYYRGARALLITSLWEGFCLPAVEALACGCPVVYKNAGSLSEIIGNHGSAFDNETQAVVALLHVKKPIHQPSYSWSAFARKIYALF